MPQSASEPKAVPAFQPPGPPPKRPANAQQDADEPFASLLDMSPPPPPPPRRDDPPPPDASQQPDPTSNSDRSDQTASSRDNQSSDRSADRSSRSDNDNKSAQSSKDCSNNNSNDGPKAAGKDKNTDKSKQADGKSADTKSADGTATGDPKASADAKSPDTALPQAQATDAIPAPVAVAPTVSAVAVANMATQVDAGTPAAGDGGNAQLPDLKILQVDAQTVGANAAKPADVQTVKHNASVAAKADGTKTDGTKTDDATSDDDTTTDGAAANGKPALLANAGDKNAATQAHAHADADAPAQHDLARFDVPAPAGADASAAAAAKSGTVQTQPINMPAPTSGTVQAPQNSATTVAQQAVPVAGLAVEIAGRALAGKNHFEIRLDPPELGRIDVHLNVDKDGQVTSHLVVDRSDTLDLLRRDASGLERALQDAGLKTSDNGLQFSLRDQSMGQQSTPNSTPDTAQIVVRDDAMPAVEATQRGYGRFAGMGGGLDIRV
ncbi:MAG: flagellar hook-length control protein FliK [Pseudolabrys sp.]